MGQHLFSGRRLLATACAAAVLTLAACGGGSDPSAKLVDSGPLGNPTVEVNGAERTPHDALRLFSTGKAGAVPVIIFKSNALWVENVFPMRTSMDSCSQAMKEAFDANSKNAKPADIATYYCVPFAEGRDGAPVIVAKRGR